ncbi:hypothetical protein [Oscillatoria sp. FACHB-1406]|uniref:hypothetical protein n=1 Tax=Oscillatoria sp. FACHB-1406 TaxID=2692846 RepID=UPI001687C523|nr:hypothetical protein [Oscillatoria sp. FACHB-1406]MBD2580117.1 hypothetical protein [Oscillatoria sp. FACHB-1406]
MDNSFFSVRPPTGKLFVEGLQRGARVKAVVERVNPLSTPLQFRLLCKLSFEEEENFRLYQRDRFQPLIPVLSIP